jgi:tetratricopeptide (TPR) repeat protein
MKFASKIRLLFAFRWLFIANCLLPIAYLLLSGCSQKKNTFTSRTFHNLAAHYNGLYWANVSLDEGIFNLDKAHKDDYTKLLPVFRYADDKAAKANYPQFDRAIEKTNKVIQYHSMLIKGKEHCRWIDENYMTMGKAHFYKRDYYAAVVVFEYVVKVFADNPVRYDAFLWLVRSYNQMNSVIKTGPILDLLKHDKNMPRRLNDDYQAVLSDYYLRTEQWVKAEEALLKAVSVTRNKHMRGRYMYILAQMYEDAGNLKQATRFYASCANLHPSYEMEFNAQLAKARTFQVESGADTKGLKKELNKMAKDEKNKEYLDQIYYALGNIFSRENDVHTAMKYYKLSAQSSLSNTRQKAVSYLSIADIYFDQKEYKPAQAYYDSTMAFLPKDYKNYDQIKNKKESLTAMIKDITIISLEDSLQQVSTMDTARISKVIDGIIAQLIKDEEKKKKDDENKTHIAGNTTPNTENNQFEILPSSGSWYFYNTASVNKGISEFFKKWGSRQSEDDWRRSSKEVVMAEQAVDTVKADSSVKGKIADNKTHAYYLKNIPFTTEQKTKSNVKIVEAYYDLGGVYKEDLQDNQMAIDAFEELLKRYPTNKYELNLYYQLYRIYLGMDNTGRANYYKEKIMNNFPNSEYAKIIRNPNYQNALLASKNEVEKFYSETFSAYHQGKFGDVIAMTSKADSFYSNSDLMPKFALLRAFSIGKTKGTDEYEHALQGVVAKYPKDDAKAKAQELLDAIKKIRSAPVDSAALKKDTVPVYKSPFTFKDSAEHQCIIIVPAKKLDMNEFKIRVSNFNQEYFSLSDLIVSDVMMDMEHKIVSIKKFPSAAKAKDYYDLINQDSKVFKDISTEEYELYPITTENFTVLYQQKKLEEYKKFFTENYLRKKEK